MDECLGVRKEFCAAVALPTTATIAPLPIHQRISTHRGHLLQEDRAREKEERAKEKDREKEAKKMKRKKSKVVAIDARTTINLEHALHHILLRGQEVEGIYRTDGSSISVEKLADKLGSIRSDSRNANPDLVRRSPFRSRTC